MEKKKNTPKLRFPEFTGEWEEKKLGEIADVKTGPFGSILHQHDYVSIGTPIITVEHLDELGIVHKNLPLVSEEDKKRLKSYLLEEGDIVFSRVGSVDRNSLIGPNENGWLFSGRLLRIRFDKEQSTPKFYNIFFQKEESKQKVRSIAVGQTMPSINTEILKSIEIKFPTLPEQTKIATFLTAVDEKLIQLKKKKTLLEQYKKGIMQKLFSQELRFKDNNNQDFPDWQEKTLGEIGEFIGGGTPSTKNNEYWSGNIPWISSSDLTEGSIFKINSTRFISEEAISQSATKLVPVNSVLIVSRVGVGKVAVSNSPLCTSQDFTNLVPLNQNSIFLAYLIKLKTDSLLGFNQGTSIKGFVKSDLESLKLLIPSLPEQQKIATFLSAIDEKISHSSAQIEKMEAWKKGLLQQMFC